MCVFQQPDGEAARRGAEQLGGRLHHLPLLQAQPGAQVRTALTERGQHTACPHRGSLPGKLGKSHSASSGAWFCCGTSRRVRLLLEAALTVILSARGTPVQAFQASGIKAVHVLQKTKNACLQGRLLAEEAGYSVRDEVQAVHVRAAGARALLRVQTPQRLAGEPVGSQVIIQLWADHALRQLGQGIQTCSRRGKHSLLQGQHQVLLEGRGDFRFLRGVDSVIDRKEQLGGGKELVEDGFV